MVCPPSEGLVSPCLPLSPFLFPFVGWCVRLPEGLVSPCLPLSPFVSLLVSLCRMVCPPSRGSCLPLSLLVSPCLSLSPLVSLVPILVSSCLPLSCLPLSPFVSPCLPLSPRWMPFVSPCLPSCFLSCFPLLDGVSAFPRVLSLLVSPLSPLVSLLVSQAVHC